VTIKGIYVNKIAKQAVERMNLKTEPHPQANNIT